MLGIEEHGVTVEAALISGDDLVVGDVFQAILYQAPIELWGLFVIGPGPNLHRLLQRCIVGVTIHDAIP